MRRSHIHTAMIVLTLVFVMATFGYRSLNQDDNFGHRLSTIRQYLDRMVTVEQNEQHSRGALSQGRVSWELDYNENGYVNIQIHEMNHNSHAIEYRYEVVIYHSGFDSDLHQLDRVYHFDGYLNAQSEVLTVIGFRPEPGDTIVTLVPIRGFSSETVLRLHILTR